ncbi:MAG: RNase adapter RapZ [Lachnospiraceae bacterium]|nr:RNase adapter RapZ [Lachnospiraceae bacterium]
MRIVIVTGMSGAGKITALRMLEDAGYYCVDNLPVPLIDKFTELVSMPGSEITKAALGLDARAGQPIGELPRILPGVKNENGLEVLFMEASDETLQKRYKTSRRRHPLSPDGEVAEGIKRERELLSEIKKGADYIIDTSGLLTRDLKKEIDRIFVDNREYNSLMIRLVSFGFKYGIPADCDLVFDVRFLPNPFYVDNLKVKTGLDSDVRDYVCQTGEAEQFLDKLTDMLNFLIPGYINEGKNQLVVGIGCTGGRHRSVTIAGKLYDRLKDSGNYGLSLKHRDIGNG